MNFTHLKQYTFSLCTPNLYNKFTILTINSKIIVLSTLIKLRKVITRHLFFKMTMIQLGTEKLENICTSIFKLSFKIKSSI